MMTLYDLQKGSICDKPMLPLSVALGNFDGLHLGHISLIEKAKCSDYHSCVFTFSKNPFSDPNIITLEQKLAILKELGVDYLAVFDFDKLKNIEWQDFIEDILLSELKLEVAVCGYDFRFGKGARGDGQRLAAYLADRSKLCHICDAVTLDGAPVSSSRIRALLCQGEIEKANRLLGRPYSVSFKVTHGNGIGRTLGFPTINQSFDPYNIRLPYGVYVCSCLGHPCVTNFGTRPTVTDEAVPYYEAYILNYKADLYGVELPVQFHKMLRPEKKFSTLEELSQQIALDVKKAEEYFK